MASLLRGEPCYREFPGRLLPKVYDTPGATGYFAERDPFFGENLTASPKIRRGSSESSLHRLKLAARRVQELAFVLTSERKLSPHPPTPPSPHALPERKLPVAAATGASAD